MNRSNGKIITIHTAESISLVTLKMEGDIEIQLLLIETPETAGYLKIGNEVTAIFKETEVILAQNDSLISIPNKIPAIISRLEKSEILTRVHLETEIGSLSALISTAMATNMNLSPTDEIVACIKINEIMLQT